MDERPYIVTALTEREARRGIGQDDIASRFHAEGCPGRYEQSAACWCHEQGWPYRLDPTNAQLQAVADAQ